MSDIRLTCEETPLSWPASIPLSDIKTCGSCGILVTSPNPGPLQISSRRQGSGVGDGVNIQESPGIGADYRGQRYSYDEAIFHSPGLHVFPGKTEVYPAEYHIHMSTMPESQPVRFLTLVIPVDHTVPVDTSTRRYFSAMRARADPAANRPTIEVLMAALSGPILQYAGPDIRRRVQDKSVTAACTSTEERQFLLVLKPASILAGDLERIPSVDGTITLDPRNLPAPGVLPSVKAISRDRLTRTTVLSIPGILYKQNAQLKAEAALGKEFECKPVKVVDGHDVVDISGKSVDIKKLLGLAPDDADDGTAVNPNDALFMARIILGVAMTCGMIVGVLFADFLATRVWGYFFNGNDALLSQWEPLKMWFFILIFILSGIYGPGILSLI